MTCFGVGTETRNWATFMSLTRVRWFQLLLCKLLTKVIVFTFLSDQTFV